MLCTQRDVHWWYYSLLTSSSIDVSKIEEDSLKQEMEALKSQLETIERLNDTLRSVTGYNLVNSKSKKLDLNDNMYIGTSLKGPI